MGNQFAHVAVIAAPNHHEKLPHAESIFSSVRSRGLVAAAGESDYQYDFVSALSVSSVDDEQLL